LYAIIKRRN